MEQVQQVDHKLSKCEKDKKVMEEKMNELDKELWLKNDVLYMKIEWNRTQNKAVYTTISVACGWAGAVMSLCKPRNSKIRDRKLDDTDQQTNRPTDGPT